MISTALVRATLLWIMAGRALAAGGGETFPYEPASVETVRGQVVRLERIAHPTGAAVHLVLRTDAGDDLPVALGPARFVERAFPIRAGDRVEVTGARVVRGKPPFVASEVKKGGQVLRLRDRYGVPVWRHGRGRRTAGTAP